MPAFSPSLLAQARERQRVSMRELARRTGRDKSMISRYESGQRVPSLATLTMLAAALELSPGEFFASDEDAAS